MTHVQFPSSLGYQKRGSELFFVFLEYQPLIFEQFEQFEQFVVCVWHDASTKLAVGNKSVGEMS